MLAGGALVAALVPLNPVVWWMARRLRLSVEQDCDRRVLTANPGVRRYADLLLVAAGTSRFSERLFAAHLGEHSSDLERRIESMTDSTLRLRPALFGTAAAALLLAVACETPRPAPVAPGLLKEKAAADPATGAYFEYQVEKPVSMAAGSATPKYPDILRQAGVEGEVLASFIVNQEGMAEVASFRAVRATHELFTTAVRNALPLMRFEPAELAGRKVKQLVQQPFSFAIDLGTGSGLKREIGKVPYYLAPDGRRTEAPSRQIDPASVTEVVVLSSTGEEVARYSIQSETVDEVRVADVASVEVMRPSTCQPPQVLCARSVIRLKPGREAAYRKK